MVTVIKSERYTSEEAILKRDPQLLALAAKVQAEGGPDDSYRFMMWAYREALRLGIEFRSIGGPSNAIIALCAGLPQGHPFDGKTDTEREIMTSDEDDLASHQRSLARYQKFERLGIEGPSGEVWSLLAHLEEAYIADRTARGIPECGLPIWLSRVGLDS